MIKEIWKKINSVPFYEASSFGRVRSIDRIIYKKNKTGKRYAVLLKGKILSHKHKNNSGYYCVLLGYRNHKMVQRLVCEAFHGEAKKNFVVSHKNGIRTDNRAENLEWLSIRENIIYGRRVLNKKGKTKNLEWAISIIKEIHSGARVIDVAKKHKVARQTISKILTGRMYKSEDYPAILKTRKKYPYSSPKFGTRWILG